MGIVTLLHSGDRSGDTLVAKCMLLLAQHYMAGRYKQIQCWHLDNVQDKAGYAYDTFDHRGKRMYKGEVACISTSMLAINLFAKTFMQIQMLTLLCGV